MSEHKGSVALATATLMDIIARGKAMQAHGVRATGPAEQETTRMEAHALLDVYLDQMADAGAHVRAIIED